MSVYKEHGFSLLELLIVLCISAVLVGLSAPNLVDFFDQTNAKNHIRKIHQLIHFARQHALNSHTLIRLCPSNNGVDCGENWLTGILIFEDPDKDKRISHQHEKVYYQAASDAKGSLHWTGSFNSLVFSGDGLAGNSAGSFIYCPESQNEQHAQALIISFAGRVRFAIDANKDGIIEAGSKGNVHCGG